MRNNPTYWAVSLQACLWSDINVVLQLLWGIQCLQWSEWSMKNGPQSRCWSPDRVTGAHSLSDASDVFTLGKKGKVGAPGCSLGPKQACRVRVTLWAALAEKPCPCVFDSWHCCKPHSPPAGYGALLHSRSASGMAQGAKQRVWGVDLFHQIPIEHLWDADRSSGMQRIVDEKGFAKL